MNTQRFSPFATLWSWAVKYDPAVHLELMQKRSMDTIAVLALETLGAGALNLVLTRAPDPQLGLILIVNLVASRDPKIVVYTARVTNPRRALKHTLKLLEASPVQEHVMQANNVRELVRDYEILDLELARRPAKVGKLVYCVRLHNIMRLDREPGLDTFYVKEDRWLEQVDGRKHEPSYKISEDGCHIEMCYCGVSNEYKLGEDVKPLVEEYWTTSRRAAKQRLVRAKRELADEELKG